MSRQRSALNVVNEYLNAFYTGDFDRARLLVAERFSFEGPFIGTDNRAEFFASAQGLTKIVRGHPMLRQWADGNDVCSVFELSLETPVGAGALPVSEWHTVRDGLIMAARVILDTAAFRALVPPPEVGDR